MTKPGEVVESLISDDSASDDASEGLTRVDSYEDLFYGRGMFLSSFSSGSQSPGFSFTPRPATVSVAPEPTPPPPPPAVDTSYDEEDYSSYLTEDDIRRNEEARLNELSIREGTAKANRQWSQIYTEDCDICQNDVANLPPDDHQSPKISCPEKIVRVQFCDSPVLFFYDVSIEEEQYMHELQNEIEAFSRRKRYYGSDENISSDDETSQ